MQCKKCGKINESDSKFCQGCGEELVRYRNTFDEIQSDNIQRKSGNGKNILAAVLSVGAIVLIGYLVYNFVLFPKGGDASRFMGKDMESLERYREESDVDFEVEGFMDIGNVSMMDDSGWNSEGDGDNKVHYMSMEFEGEYNILGFDCGQRKSDVNADLSDYDEERKVNGYYDGKVAVLTKYSVEENMYLRITTTSGEIVKIECFDDMVSGYIEEQEDLLDELTGATDDSGTGDDTYSYDNSDTDSSAYSYDDSDTDSATYSYDDSDEEGESDYSDDYSDEYIIPDSDSRKLTEDDVIGLTDEEIRIARNEIYARHGRLFNDSELQEYFDSLSWYYGYIEPEDFVETEELSKLERKNARFLAKYN